MFLMSSNNNGNRIVVPEARQAMDQFKMEAASEVGVASLSGTNPNISLFTSKNYSK